MQKARVRNRQAGMRHEITQQVELFGRKVNRLAGLANQPASRIELDISDSDYRVGIDMEADERLTAARMRAASSRMLNGLVM
jgi:hypothetical protein